MGCVISNQKPAEDQEASYNALERALELADSYRPPLVGIRKHRDSNSRNSRQQCGNGCQPGPDTPAESSALGQLQVHGPPSGAAGAHRTASDGVDRIDVDWIADSPKDGPFAQDSGLSASALRINVRPVATSGTPGAAGPSMRERRGSFVPRPAHLSAPVPCSNRLSGAADAGLPDTARSSTPGGPVMRAALDRERDNFFSLTPDAPQGHVAARAVRTGPSDLSPESMGRALEFVSRRQSGLLNLAGLTSPLAAGQMHPLSLPNVSED